MRSAIVESTVVHPILGKVKLVVEVSAVWNGYDFWESRFDKGEFDCSECLQILEAYQNETPIDSNTIHKYFDDLCTLVEEDEQNPDFQEQMKDYANQNWDY